MLGESENTINPNTPTQHNLNVEVRKEKIVLGKKSTLGQQEGIIAAFKTCQSHTRHSVSKIVS